MKFKFNSFGMKIGGIGLCGGSGNGVGGGSITLTNQFNITSPYKPIKTENLEIYNSFMDKQDNYNLLNSPLIGKINNLD